MNDLSCAADIYAIMRKHVPANVLPKLAQEAVEIFLDEGYSNAKIEDELGDFDEIYDALDATVDYGEEYEEEVEDDEEEVEYDSEYYDEE